MDGSDIVPSLCSAFRSVLDIVVVAAILLICRCRTPGTSYLSNILYIYEFVTSLSCFGLFSILTIDFKSTLMFPKTNLTLVLDRNTGTPPRSWGTETFLGGKSPHLYLELT